MASSKILISSQTLGTSASSVTFSSIPDTYTDLVIKWSARGTGNGNNVGVRLNGSSVAQNYRVYLLSDGTSVTASSDGATAETTADMRAGYNPANATANTFSNSEILIPNYLSPTYKPMGSLNATENNSTTAYISANANLTTSTSTVTSVELIPGTGSFVAGSSFYLYGVTRVAASTVPSAPTVGAVTVSDAAASVAFTAPGSGSAVDIYKVTSSPGSLTGYGYYSPIAVSGLTNGTAYTFSVQGVNNQGSGTASSASSSVTPLSQAFEPIATVTGTGSSSTLTFSSIPSTYKHLQIRGMFKDTSTTAASRSEYRIRFNGSSTGYMYHHLYGNGSTASAIGQSAAHIVVAASGLTSGTGLTNSLGVSIVDIYNYASSTTTKVTRSISSCDANLASTGYQTALCSGLWNNTNAITSISILTDGAGNFSTASTFTLYGIKG